MAKQETELQQQINSGKMILIAEVKPPKGADPEPLRKIAKQYAGKVCALGVSDNRKDVSMSAVAAASIIAAEGVEPILHMVTRDRNRIALISDTLGAQALGVSNVLYTSGMHQTLGNFKTAKNVFDIDSIQLLRSVSDLAKDGSIVGEDHIPIAPFCLGAVADPCGDPLEMQVMRLSKKVKAGAQYIITKPVFDIERFQLWWQEVSEKGLHEKVAIIAGIRLLKDVDSAKAYASTRPDPMIPDELLERIGSTEDKNEQREEGIKIALETIEKLSAIEGIRGFEIYGDGDDAGALEIINRNNS